MGYMMLWSPCLICRKVFASNPTHVPSLRGEPVCKDCIDLGNKNRIKAGIKPFPVHPKAYEPEEV